MSKTKKPAQRKARRTTDAIEVLHHRYVNNDREMARMVAIERSKMDIAGKIYDLRTAAGLSQRELAERVATTASVICRLEGADYEGHSLAMLHRIAAALDKRVEIRFVPIRTALRRS